MEKTRKRRILFISEFSELATGYSVYTHEVMKRWHATGKYELAELACYTSPDDPRYVTRNVPWTVFPGMPATTSVKEINEFNSDKLNQFGAWNFEDVCLKFLPDIVVDIRDNWMMEFEERSPFRKFYHWVVMPTVDSAPQQEQWIATYINADAVFTYSDWGLKTLDTEGGGLIKTVCSAPPGADLTTFYPMDRLKIRKIFGLDKDAIVIGTVMRNQGRKLYPELLEAFQSYLRQAPADVAARSFLYLHTSYPDQGWDIPRLIKQHGLGHKVLMTYKCRDTACATVFPAFFMDARGTCPSCKQLSAFIPNVQLGVDRATLAKIINVFDVYVQYANSEGFGMPQVEAASCGVPVFATDYSAMSDVVRKLNGYPIKVDRYILEGDFGVYRAWPDNQDFIDKLIKYITKTYGERNIIRKKAREAVEKHYRWEETAKKWENVFDSLPLKSPEESWFSPPRLHEPVIPQGNFESNEQFVEWAIEHVFGKPEFKNSYMALRLIRDLNWGMKSHAQSAKSYHNETSFAANATIMGKFTEQNVVEELVKLCQHWNLWETRRRQLVTPKG